MDATNTTLMSSLRYLLPVLLKDHAYGLYELAETCAVKLHEPTCEIMTVFSDCLCELVDCGLLNYDRQNNRVLLVRV